MAELERSIELGKSAYNELKDTLVPLYNIYSEKVRKIDVEDTLDKFNTLIQYGLLKGAIGEGRLDEREIIYISELVDTPALLGFIKEETGRSYRWNELLNISPYDIDSILVPLSNKVLNGAIETANVLIDVITMMPEKGQAFYNYVVAKVIQVVTCLINIDKDPNEKEVESALSSILFVFLSYVKDETNVRLPSIEEINEINNGNKEESKDVQIVVKKKKDVNNEEGIIAKRGHKEIKEFYVKANSDPALEINYDAKELAVVYIETKAGSGSGFVISDDGVIFTCNHVIDGFTNADVYLISTDGRRHKYNAKVIYADADNDRACLKIDSDEKFYYYDIEEDYKSIRSGDDVAVFGYPFGRGLNDNVEELEPTLSKGYVGSKNRIKGKECYYLDIWSAPGNSGGPVFCLKDKKVIGYLCGSYGHESVSIIYIRPLQDFLKFFK